MQLLLINILHVFIGILLFFMGIMFAAYISIAPTMHNLGSIGLAGAFLIFVYWRTWLIAKKHYPESNSGLFSGALQNPAFGKYLGISLVIYQLITALSLYYSKAGW